MVQPTKCLLESSEASKLLYWNQRQRGPDNQQPANPPTIWGCPKANLRTKACCRMRIPGYGSSPTGNYCAGEYWCNSRDWWSRNTNLPQPYYPRFIQLPCPIDKPASPQASASMNQMMAQQTIKTLRSQRPSQVARGSLPNPVNTRYR